MNRAFTAIHFKAEGWPNYANGVAKFSSAGIVFEFESKFLGMFSNGVKELRVSLADIHSVKFRRGFLKIGASIVLRLNSISKSTKLPNDNGKIVLKLSREDVEAAREAVATLEKDMAENAASLPPPAASVSELFDGTEPLERETRKLAGQ
ncbi:MAG: hypothetical protein LC113_08465 [Acidobacteria bacterium]|nr:hypothetical protein [Acidobacteriota bacterium]